jgi:small conductance mechanosensitive channel
MGPTEIIVDLAIRYGFQVLGAVVILVVGAVAAKWIGSLTDRGLEKKAIEPPMRKLIVRVVKVVVILFAGVVALDKFGFQIAPLVAGIGVAGIGVGFALQGVLSNVMAGLTIIFTKPFRVSEYIELLNVHGEVVAIELFSTTLVHADRSRVVIPNRKIVGEILHNYGSTRQLHLAVAVPHGSDLAGVLRAARGVVEANPRVLREPAAGVGIARVGDAGVTISVDPWVRVGDYSAAEGELYEALVVRFRQIGVGPGLPQREVRLIDGGAAATR